MGILDSFKSIFAPGADADPSVLALCDAHVARHHWPFVWIRGTN
jgi:hypothetical protein